MEEVDGLEVKYAMYCYQAVLLWLNGNDSLFWMYRSRIVGVPDLLSVEPQALNQLFI